MSDTDKFSKAAEHPEIIAAREFQRLIGTRNRLHQPFKDLAGSPERDHSGSVDLFQLLPVALYTTDAAGRITFYNEAAAILWGHRPKLGTDEWCGSWRLYWPDGTFLPHDECPMAMALKEGRAIHGMEAAAERPDGIRVPFLAFPTPIFDNSGKVIGAVNMLVDITERKISELAAQRLTALVESSDDAILSMDLQGVVSSWNLGAELLYGYTENEIVGKSVTILIASDRQEEEAKILARIQTGERIKHFETVRQRKDGTLMDVSLTVSPIIGQNGKIIGASKIARDISDQKAAENFKDVLLGEMKHRVKNSLALAASIGRQTFHSATDSEHITFASRIQALGAAHDILSKQSWEGACLKEVVTKAMEPHRTGQGRIHIAGPDISIDSGKAVAIALALHELATNAAKYGALSGSGGAVHVGWETLDDDLESVRLCWQERDGPSVEKPELKGFGSRLIERGLAAQFETVALDFRPEGVTCIVEFSRSTPKDGTVRPR